MVAFSFAFSSSYAVFWAIKKTMGLRVSAEQEEAGLDIVEHGMFGYPEQFIPPEEADVQFPAGTPAPVPGLAAPAPAASEA